MNRNLLVIAAGGHGKVVADAALAGGTWETVAFVDDRIAATESVLGLPVVGPTSLLPALRDRFAAVAVAIGASSERMRMLEHCRSLGFALPIIAHPSAVISSFAILQEGCVVCAQAVVSPGARLGIGCIVNTSASVDHDCQLGAGVHVCPGTRLAGDVHVGSGSWIGIGACVRQGTVIGANVTVGAGAVVVADVPSGLTVTGVPARPRSAR